MRTKLSEFFLSLINLFRKMFSKIFLLIIYNIRKLFFISIEIFTKLFQIFLSILTNILFLSYLWHFEMRFYLTCEYSRFTITKFSGVTLLPFLTRFCMLLRPAIMSFRSMMVFPTCLMILTMDIILLYLKSRKQQFKILMCQKSFKWRYFLIYFLICLKMMSCPFR